MRRLLRAIGALNEGERDDVRRSVAALAWDDRVADLPDGKRDALAKALRRVPRTPRPRPLTSAGRFAPAFAPGLSISYEATRRRW